MFDHIIVVGNGKTSRANVEALIDDYIHANPKIKFTLYNPMRLSEGQVWLKQYLSDKEISHATHLEDVETTLEVDDGTAMFVLWDDEDQDSVKSLAVAKELKIPAYDLTDGLVLITPNAELKISEEPKIPVSEQLTEEEPEVVTEEAEEEPEEDTYEDPLYEAIRVVASIFAEAISEELKKVLKK